MKVHVPWHLNAETIGAEAYRRAGERWSGRPVPKTKYIYPKTIGIREYIAMAKKLKKI